MSRLRQREKEKHKKAGKIRDEIQYLLKKKMWAAVDGKAEFDLKAADYYSIYDKLVAD